MNNSSDFMMYLHEDKVQRMRQDMQGRPVNRGLTSPFARVRSTISLWVGGTKDRDLNQS